MSDELRCEVCGQEAQPNEKGRLILEHDWRKHSSESRSTSATPVTPLRRPSRTGAWGDDDD
jgi:hypothetical protein